MRLDRTFFARPTLEVAPDLVGKLLVRRLGRDVLAGRIVEAEAYLGHPDAASHASRKNPTRARIMFGPPGHAYVYMVYGMYYCLNLVTEPDGAAGAVLVRAVEPVEGIDVMRRLRGKPMPDRNLTSGPGKLCQAFAVDMGLNGVDLCAAGSSRPRDAARSSRASGSRAGRRAAGPPRRELWVEDRGHAPERIRTGPRVGVDYAGAWARKPWRFWEDGNAYVSKPPRKRP